MRLVSAVVCIFVFAVTMLAQTDRGTITGTVQDPTQAVVPGASVVATNVSGVEFKGVTTATGNYTIPMLPAGVYRLTVEAPGFKRFVQENIQVQVSQTIRVDASLQVGATSETITVQEQAPLLKTESAEQSTVVSTDLMNQLPLNFGMGAGSTGAIRSPFAFNILSPGVVNNPSQFQADYLPINGVTGGGGFGSFRVQVEGQDATSVNDPNWTSTVSHGAVDMIQEFSLQTSNFSAEYGQAAGGLYNFTTKSGTNDLHGSGYWYWTNEALNATRPFTFTNPRSRKNDFGFTVGGPVYIPKLYNGRNRTFFFFSWEMFRNSMFSGGSSFLTLPTAAMRSGDFTQNNILTGRNLGTDVLGRSIMEGTIYDPSTARTLASGQVITDPFDGNRIPQNRFDPVAAKIQGLIPATTNSAVTNNFAQFYTNYRREQIPAVKIDEVLPDNSKLSFYLSKQMVHQLTGPDGLPYPISAVRVQSIYGTTPRLNYDRAISPTILLHLGAGAQRFHNPDSSPPEVLQYDAVGRLGFTGSATSPAGFPRINGLSFGMGPSNANKYYDTSITSVASVTYIRGNHTYKTGVELKINSWTDRNSRGSQGVLSLNGNETAMPYLQSTSVGSGTIGNSYASFLLGQVDSATVTAVVDPQLRRRAWAMYAQDTWKIRRNLTLDYGLRWDYQDMGHEIHYRNSMFGPTIPNPTVNNIPGALVYEGYGPGRCNCQFTTAYPYAIGPRLGVAYQIDSKTVFRGGIGISYGYLPTLSYITNITPVGVGFNTVSLTSPAFGTPAFRMVNGMQYDRSLLTDASLNPGLVPNPGQINSPGYYLDRNGGRPSRILQWNIGIQREVLRGLIVEAAYVGNRAGWVSVNGWGGTTVPNMNAIPPATYARVGIDPTTSAGQALLNSTFKSGIPQANGFSLPYPTFPQTLTLAQALRPFPQFGNINVFWAPVGHSWYDSLQAKVTRRYSSGLMVTSAFTWSKNLANPASTGSINNFFNWANQKAITGNDEPFVFSAGFTYETQKYTSSKLVNNLLAGWAVGGLLVYSSGMPILTPNSSNTHSNWYFQNTRENRVAGTPLFTKDLNCHCINPYQDFVLNPAAWQNPAPGQWGTAAAYYSDYRYERRPNEQMNIGRRFRIKERYSLEVRAEFFNVFNRTYLANPTTTGPQSAQVRNATTGNTVSGFGYINPTSLYMQPRNGQLVARFTF
jgi:hypothetical protein